MYWKYLIKVLEDHQLVEVRIDAWDSLASEIKELLAEGATVLGVFDRDGHRVSV